MAIAQLAPTANFSSLSQETKALMVVYSRAIGACNLIPVVSTSIVQTYFASETVTSRPCFWLALLRCDPSPHSPA